MHIGSTLGAYFGRQYLFWLVCVYVSILSIIFVVDLAETLRDAAGQSVVPFGIIATMSLLRLPHLSQEAMPFTVLFGAMFAFVRQTRSHELVVARAAGVSAWQFLLPALVLTLVLGAAKIGIMNPIAASLLGQYDRVAARYFGGGQSLTAVSSSGLWLRQVDQAGDHSVIHAASVEPDSLQLMHVTIYRFRGQDEFVQRIDASSAELGNGEWVLEDGWVSGPSKPGEPIETYSVPTNLTIDRIKESFARPETINFWQLPHFIRVLEATGLSSLPHRLHWHALLAEPILLLSMTLIAATFSLRLTRRGGTSILVISGIAAGFVLYMLTNVIHALGLGASLPVMLAAWTPAGICLTLGAAMMLHMEDG